MRAIPLFSPSRPWVIAHRGASGRLPEQTLEAFDLAIEQGAAAIELDVVPTRDGVLIARHENELSATTHIADRSAFTSRRTTRDIEGGTVTGWFTEDFTADEIRSLRARQRFSFRDHSCDDRFMVPTLDDVLEWRVCRQQTAARQIGVFIEIKHPTYFAGIGLNAADLLLSTLDRHDLRNRDCGAVLMSFETRVLRHLRGRSQLPLVQLLDAPQAKPFDWAHSGDARTFADLLAPPGLAEIAEYADGIGPWKRLIVPVLGTDIDGATAGMLQLAPPTSLIKDAHTAGLFVCAWTFRDEPQFLATDYGGNPTREYEQFYRLGLDAVISDFPDTATPEKSGPIPHG